MPGKAGCVDILDAVKACAREVERLTARAGVTVALAMPTFVGPVRVNKMDFRRTVAELLNQVLSETSSGRKLTMSFSLPRPDTLAIEVRPAGEPAARSADATHTAHVPIQRADG